MSHSLYLSLSVALFAFLTSSLAIQCDKSRGGLSVELVISTTGKPNGRGGVKDRICVPRVRAVLYVQERGGCDGPHTGRNIPLIPLKNYQPEISKTETADIRNRLRKMYLPKEGRERERG